jgi:hypothetical protein
MNHLTGSDIHRKSVSSNCRGRIHRFLQPCLGEGEIVKYLLWCLVGGIAGLSAAIAQPASTTSKSPAAQRTYCELSFTDFAGGFVHRGVYINPDGDLNSYSYRPDERELQLKENEKITEQQLEDKYNHGRKFVR